MPTDVDLTTYFDFVTVSPSDGKTWTFDPSDIHLWHEPRTWRCRVSEWLEAAASRINDWSFRVDPHREKASDLATFTFESEEKE